MQLILAWVLFPFVLALIGAGWGFLVDRLSGGQVNGALLLPLGLAAALVVAGTLNAVAFTAPATVPVVAVGAAVGLPFAWRGRRRLSGWALLAALGALLAYGAPVLLSGHATFSGFLTLDDTAYWFNIIDHISSGPDTPSGELPSSYSLQYEMGILDYAYPLGSFMLPGVARGLTGVDTAWVFQPYLACCAAAIALGLFALAEQLISSPRVRALVAFLAAQAALLYGYSLWGGIKELTSAFLLVLLAALAAAALRRRPTRARELLPLAVAAGALLQTLGLGGAAWVAPIFALLAGSWLVWGWRQRERLAGALPVIWLGALTTVMILPVWLTLGGFFSDNSRFFSSGQSEHTRLGNLIGPLNDFQAVGIWPIGDFRLTPPELPTVLLIALALLMGAGALSISIRRRVFGLPIFVGVVLIPCIAMALTDATPWVSAKALAVAAPALLLAGLTGAAMLGKRNRAGFLVLAILAFGVLWSNALAYQRTTLAPRDRLEELQQIGELVSGEPPTLLNESEVYAVNHFLRKGAPVGPAEYRPVNLALSDGTLLTRSAWSDLDSLPLATVEEYPSLVTRRSPAESRPPSNYRLVWHGKYYNLWQRSAHSSSTIVEHVPLGESTTISYCGAADPGAYRPLCSVIPVATPTCDRILGLGQRARQERLQLVCLPPPPTHRRLWGSDPVARSLVSRHRRSQLDGHRTGRGRRPNCRGGSGQLPILAQRQLWPRSRSKRRRRDADHRFQRDLSLPWLCGS